jgi:hypothetical protein
LRASDAGLIGNGVVEATEPALRVHGVGHLVTRPAIRYFGYP